MRTTAGVLVTLGMLGVMLVAGACAADHRIGGQEEPAITPAPAQEEPSSSAGETNTPAAHDLQPTPPAPAVGRPADNTSRGWYYTSTATHAVPAVAPGADALLRTYGGRFTGPDPACVYLTFDEGYENGNTGSILDALARNGVQATFFVTASYVRNNPDLVRRMVDEGHAVGNHSATHPSMPTLATESLAFETELAQTAQAFEEVTGCTIAPVFRPPMGEYSPLSLWLTQSLGYESIFWSFAHRDWVVDDQPPVDVTVKRMLTGSHPGAIYLLHGVSSSDAQALDAGIAGLRTQGYRLGTLGG